MYKSRIGRFGRTSPRSKVSRSSSRQSLRGRFELLEPRLVLSVPAPTTVGIVRRCWWPSTTRRRGGDDVHGPEQQRRRPDRDRATDQ